MALTDKLTAIADAIRKKNGGTELLTLDEMASAIEAIESGIGQDNTVVEFNQVNDTAKSYLISAESYTSDDDYSITVAEQYYSASESANHDDPVGYDVTVTSAGTIYITDETTGKTIIDAVSDNKYTIYNVIPGHIYFYRIADSSGNTVNTGRIKGTGSLRMLKTYTTTNFRDLGGWNCDGGTIKYGLLLRGGKVGTNSGISANTKDLKMIRDFGTLVEVDLRGDSETGKDTSDTSDDLIISQAGSYIDYYDFTMGYIVNAIMPNRPEITTTLQVLRLIMNSVVNEAPVYYHCSAGADRTGGISYVLEGLLGVSETDMMKEYELTTLAPYLERYRTNLSQTATYIKSLDGDTWQDKWITWAFSVGFTADELNAFRSAMINGTPSIIEAPKNIYSITNTLSSVSTSNSMSVITEGDSYSATLTAENDMEINNDAVYVTMGGIDISATAYDSDTNTITISNVIGDIVIIASAIKSNYSIAYNLTKCTSTNTSVSVKNGSSYTSTIVSDDGYELLDKNITITMGGHIVSDVYSSGSISIGSVTGDIVITCVATAIPTYTNLVPTSLDFDLTSIYGDGNGYINGKYASEWSSDGLDSAYVCTGLIPINVSSANDTNDIYIKGATLDTSASHTRCRAAFKNESKYHLWINGGNNWGTYFTITQLDTNYYKLSVLMSSGIQSCKLFKFSLKGTGENLIITFNEPIE